jgi:hypothetical protein
MGQPLIIIRNPKHRIANGSVFHFIGERAHFLGALTPMRWIIHEHFLLALRAALLVVR